MLCDPWHGTRTPNTLIKNLRGSVVEGVRGVRGVPRDPRGVRGVRGGPRDPEEINEGGPGLVRGV